MKLKDSRELWSDLAAGRRPVVVEHRGPVRPGGLGRRIESRLRERGFETELIDANDTCIVKGRHPSGWIQTIGASPSLEVKLHSVPRGTEIDIHLARAGAATWATRYFTSSWLPLLVWYADIKKDLLGFAQGELLTDAGVIEVVETSRSEESLGADVRIVDNAQSDVTVTRSIRATKRWMQSCNIQVENSRVQGKSAELSIPDVGSLRGSMEDTLRRQYSASTEVEQIFEEEVTLTVPPRTSLRFIMEWKTILQKGYILVRDHNGQIIEVPFEMALGVTFDQKQLGDSGGQAE